MDPASSEVSSESARWSRASHTALATVLMLAAFALLWFLFDVLLLAFAAVLLAVVIRAPTDWLQRRTPLPSGVALALVLVAIVALLTAAGWLLGGAITQQVGELVEQLPQMLTRVRQQLGDYGVLGGDLDPAKVLDQGGAFIGRGMSVISATFGALANLVLVLFMAVLFATQPQLYVRGSLRLAPLHRRARLAEMYQRIGDTLRRWMMGQLALMTFVGTLSSLGLSLLGVPYALALGLLAGLLTFVPFIGPLVAAFIAIVVSLADGWMAAVYVAALYTGIQVIEGLLEPFVHQRAVSLPPALLLLSQVVFGVLVGALGVVLATPLAAALMVAITMLYVEDVLGDRDGAQALSPRS